MDGLPFSSDAEQLISAKDAANLFGVSPETIRRWRRDDRIPVVVLPSGIARYSRVWCQARLEHRGIPSG
jgi:predicted site-specific integrase-resolvase